MSYLYVNETSFYTDILIYGIIALTTFTSLFLYKKIQKDLKQQEKNAIQLEINDLLHKLENAKDEKIFLSYTHKLNILKKELHK
ncbi:MAG TPA: hypothetical protein EYG97_03135 [Arcobacter sp.]|nr:hypothetical protein [Arcobacter sp.]